MEAKAEVTPNATTPRNDAKNPAAANAPWTSFLAIHFQQGLNKRGGTLVSRSMDMNLNSFHSSQAPPGEQPTKRSPLLIIDVMNTFEDCCIIFSCTRSWFVMQGVLARHHSTPYAWLWNCILEVRTRQAYRWKSKSILWVDQDSAPVEALISSASRS